MDADMVDEATDTIDDDSAAGEAAADAVDGRTAAVDTTEISGAEPDATTDATTDDGADGAVNAAPRGGIDGIAPETIDVADGPADAVADDAGLDPVAAVIAAAHVERDEYKDIALRLQADFDNYRRRMSTQQQAEVDRATGKLAEALLPVLDAAEAAFIAHPAEVEPLFNLLLGELRRQGLESMNLLEQPFDPNLAEAVMTEPGDGGEPVVSEVLRSGYIWKGRTLRAAMVKVRG